MLWRRAQAAMQRDLAGALVLGRHGDELAASKQYCVRYMFFFSAGRLML